MNREALLRCRREWYRQHSTSHPALKRVLKLHKTMQLIHPRASNIYARGGDVISGLPHDADSICLVYSLVKVAYMQYIVTVLL